MSKHPDHTRPVTDAVWNHVLALAWTDKQRTLLEKMREAGPEGLSYEAAGRPRYSRYVAMNGELRKAELDVRFGHAGPRERGRSFTKERWYLFHVS